MIYLENNEAAAFRKSGFQDNRAKPRFQGRQRSGSHNTSLGLDDGGYQVKPESIYDDLIQYTFRRIVRMF